MEKYNFKIGDEVKICDSSRWKKRIKDTIGVVREVNGDNIFIKWRTKRCIVCGIGNFCRFPESRWRHKSCEIEPIVKVGEQLLFNFMLKGD